MKKLLLLVFATVLAFGQSTVFAKEEYLQEVLPGDDPLIIEFDEVNSYLMDMESYDERISESLIERSSLKEVTSIYKEIASYKKTFDNNIETLNKEKSDKQLADLGLTNEQINIVRNYSYNDDDRISLAASYSGYVSVFTNLYNSTYGRSEVYYGFVGNVSGVLAARPTVATGIRTSSPGGFIRQSSSINARYEYSDGSSMYSSGTDHSTYKGGVHLLPIHVSGAGLKNFVAYYRGYAQGNHRVISLLGTVGVPTISINSVSLGFSGDGPTLSIDLVLSGSKRVNISVPQNR